MDRDAVISSSGTYRYLLTRYWDYTKPRVGFVMLNPSTADAKEDDPTIRRCINFAKSWGYGGIVVGNLFAYRATDPKKLTQVGSPVGPQNDVMLDRWIFGNEKVGLVIAAWGAHSFAAARGKELCRRHPNRLSCLGVTKAGHPKHPLYLRADTKPIPFDPEEIR